MINNTLGRSLESSWTIPLATRRLAAVLALVSVLLSGCNSGGGGSNGGIIPNTTGPTVSTATYVDVDGNGVDGGDVVLVSFTEPVRLLSGSAFSFDLDDLLDTFGAGATMRQSVPTSEWVEVTLGAGADFVPGLSTMDMREGNLLSITDLEGDDARTSPASIVIEDATLAPPTIVSATYADLDRNGEMNVGDALLVGFDKPIQIPLGASFSDNFLLPVDGDSLGLSPILSPFTAALSNRAVLITFDSAPGLTVNGSFDSAVVTVGSASGLGVSGTPTITDTVSTGPTPIEEGSGGVDVGLQGTSFFRTGQPGSLFTGNTDGSSPNVGPAGFFGASGVCHFEGSVLGSPEVDLCFVADTQNHRVLVFDGLPAGNFANANVVLGQGNFDENLPNRSSDAFANATASSLHTPVDVHYHAESNSLYVSDQGNHRILVFTGVVDTNTGQLALQNGDPATMVVGQTSLSGSQPNQGGVASSRSLGQPAGIHVEGTQLAVADQGNHRVLLWSSLPSADNAAASVVLGQPDFVSTGPNGGFASVDGAVLSGPNDVVIDSTVTINGVPGAVLVADTGNHRVLVWHGTNPAWGAPADRVIGQPNFVTGAPGAGAAGLHSPRGVEVFPVAAGPSSSPSIFVADSGNDRIAVYDFGVSLPSGPAASIVLGGGGPPADDTLAAPERVSLSIGSAAFLFVTDRGNHRVLEFPVSGGLPELVASAQLGQPDFTTAMPNGHTMNLPRAICFAGGRMIVADTDNHRVLIYDTTPQSGDPTPSVVVGQPSPYDTSPNQGLSGPTAATLRRPTGVATDGTRLVISDTGNHRVLIFDTIPTATGASADVVLGQADFLGGFSNSGGVTASTLDTPRGVEISGTDLLVCDQDNHRVLVWSDLTTVVSGSPADLVLGQDDFFSRLPNQGDVTTASSLHAPSDVQVAQGMVWVADTANHRVVGFPDPLASSSAATRVLGQPDFHSSSPGLDASSLNGPSGLATDGERFFVADTGSSRVVLLDSLAAAGSVSFHAVIGQSGFGQGSVNRGLENPSPSTLSRPEGLFFDGTSLYVVDTGNSRIFRVR